MSSLSSISEIYNDISKQYETYKKRYQRLEQDKLLAQALLYCENGPSIIYEDGVISEFIKSDQRFQITKRGKLYVRATSKIGDDGGPTKWLEDEDIYRHGYIIWSDEEQQDEDDDESIWDSDDEERVMLSEIRNKYNINRAKINDEYLQSSGDNGFSIEKNTAIAYISTKFMVVQTDPVNIKKFIKDYQKN